MKKISFCLIIGSLLISCQKSKTDIAPSLFGTWKGKFGIGANVSPNQDVIFEFKDDGTMLIYNGADKTTATTKGTGTYVTIDGFKEISCKYMYTGNQIPYAVMLTTTAAFQTMTGTWTYNQGTPGGKIEFMKQ